MPPSAGRGATSYSVQAVPFRSAMRNEAEAIRWGKNWGKKPHKFEPIPADIDLAKTALESAPPSPADRPVKAHNPKVAGSNPAPAIGEGPGTGPFFLDAGSS